MKKSKLLIFLLAAVSSVSLISAATLTACTPADNNNDGNDNTQIDGDDENQHHWSSEWQSDENNHWKECEDDDCTQITESAAHTYGEWTVTKQPTETEEGSRERECTVCGHKQTETLAKIVYEKVTTAFDYATFIEIAGGTSSSYKLTEDTTVGKFTVEEGAYFDTTGGLDGTTVNNQQKKITFTLSGRTNSISFDYKCASSGGCTLTLYKEDGTVVKAWEKIEQNAIVLDVSYGVADGESLPAGTYYLDSEGSARIANLSITEELEQSDVTGISVSASATKFLAGREFSSAGLSVTLNYQNGREDAVTSGYEVDDSAVDMTKAGTYTVTVSYEHDGTTYSDTYEVKVFETDHLELSDYSLNSSRVTLPVQKLFNKGDTFNYNNLAVQAIAKCGNEEETFVLQSDEYTASSADTSATGAKTITVTETNSKKTANYGVYVVDLATADKTQVKVDADGTVGVAEGVLTVNTINDAIQAFKLMQSGDNVIKTITVAAGTYNEKVEIDIPNVRLIGSGTTAKDTTIVFDALNGLTDPSGTTTYSTDGSATVSIRESAEGFYAENITFKNYYNTNALYEESKLIAGSGTQAVAALVQADKAYFKNCFFTSYHDTLYAMTGRQVYENCEIEGRTDYIFGYNATAYFKNCKINTIGAADKKNGGYIVATKGLKEGAGVDAVKYGYIFDGCTLGTTGEVITSAEYAAADEAGTLKGTEIVEGTVSLARGWDTAMTVAFINCDISSAYSLEAYGEKTMVDGVASKDDKNDRYTKMNAAPVASQLFEYNNKGAGALTQDMIDTAVDGVIADLCTVMTEAQATEYTTLTTIFAAENGKLIYADSWNGQPVQIATITIKLADGTTVGTAYGYVNNFVPQSVLSAAVDESKLPAGADVAGFTLDSAATTVQNEIMLEAAEVTVYVVTKTAAATKTYTLYISSVSGTAYTVETLINDIFYATTAVKGESVKYDTLKELYDRQVSLTGGKADPSNAAKTCAIKFTIEKSATVTVIAAAKSDKPNVKLAVKTADNSDASISELTINGQGATEFDLLNVDGTVDTYTFVLGAGTYYLGGSGGGAYLYGLSVEVEV